MFKRGSDMNGKSKHKNPWNKNTTNPKNNGKPKSSSEDKFKEAHLKLQSAVQKHIKNYESSSEEEDGLDSTNLVESVLKNYSLNGGVSNEIERTQKYIEDSLQSGAATCLICISTVKRNNQIWSCVNCYDFFHLLCIQRWSKDNIAQQKQCSEELMQLRQTQKPIHWCCPKCRFEYSPHDIPNRYLCFCGKKENPKPDPYLVPHSCGEICKKSLTSNCGHKCLLLCHPGPCPPCPVTIQSACHCGRVKSTRRCSNSAWSCGGRCDRTLPCGKHQCHAQCHAGDCEACKKKSVQKCACGARQQLRECASPFWQCDKVCGKPLSCGNHTCEKVCHSGDCGECPLTKPRSCPCGKTTYELPCTVEDPPTCKDTCDKLLECGQHRCNQKCHKGKCETCLETVVKQCRCGKHSKEIQCSKPFLCESKCKNIKDCNKHPCNRKCCDGISCPPCEKPCDRTLSCGNHKCASVCHRGPCYPCQQTETVSCKCGYAKITVPCGRKHKTRPPKCNQLCKQPPDCHHPSRAPHRCHYGECPPCKQPCGVRRPGCPHTCSAPCHSATPVKLAAPQPATPCEMPALKVEKRPLPCPPCQVPVPFTCHGEHETVDFPCHTARPYCCGRPCGRLLECGNHFCQLPCHKVTDASDKTKAGKSCEQCCVGCDKPRPPGCPHPCPLPCHPGACPPCSQMIRIKCYCGLTQPYVPCHEWIDVNRKAELQSCGNQCPKNFACGHRCKSNCHPGPCPNADQCKKKVKVSCKCKRIKKEFQCELVRKNQAVVECDEMCKKQQEAERKNKQALEEQRKKEEEERNKAELEKYQKKFEGKKKNRERRRYEETEDVGFMKKYWYFVLSGGLISLAVSAYFMFD